MDRMKQELLVRPPEKPQSPAKEPISREHIKRDIERAQLVLLTLRLQLDSEPKK